MAKGDKDKGSGLAERISVLEDECAAAGLTGALSHLAEAKAAVKAAQEPPAAPEA